MDHDIKGKAGSGMPFTRRGFAGSVLAAAGLIAARLSGKVRAAAPVSIHEAAHYVKLDREEER